MTEFGIQMYSLRDITKSDMNRALSEIARMGYKTAEFAGFFGYKSEYIKGLLEKYGIKAVATHTGCGDLVNNFAATVAYHKAIGCTDIIIPGASIYDRKGIEEFIENVNKWIPALKAEGITLHYHNHDGEFKEVADGFVPHDELATRTELKFEIDTYWAYVAGRDPIEVLEHYGDRVEFIHLKDGFADRTGKSLGQGTAPVAAVLDYAVKTGKKIVVESEGLDPTGLEEVERCANYLKASGK